jgi:hypothetical protein
MRSSTVGGDGLPLCRRSNVVVPTRPLAILHLDSVKRRGCDGSGLEPHRTGDVGAQAARDEERLQEHTREMEEGEMTDKRGG